MVTTTELPSLRDIRDRDPYPVYEAYHWRARVATQDVKLAGVTIRAGDRVHPVNAAANRDPNYWPDPTRFDIDRPRLPTHLAFNVGRRPLDLVFDPPARTVE